VKSARIILCLNSGSSSRKLALFRFEDGVATALAQGAVEGIGQPIGRLWFRDGENRTLASDRRNFPDGAAALDELFAALERLRPGEPGAIGHRLVHGGPERAAPERVTPALLDDLHRLIPLAPMHLPGEIEAIEAAGARFPGVAQVVCFDTAFHRAMPEIAARFPLARELWDAGVRRYGFHGISYEYIMQALGAQAPGRIVIAHLGNGASMAAVRDGRAVETTMGFTPAGGFMMGTRSGDLDPGALVYLMNEMKYDGARIGRMVNREAGLLGVSGLSSDMKTLLDARGSDPRAAQAVAMFCYQARMRIGALAAVLGGLDLLVFTGGIGENAAPVRAEICRGLEFLGIALDDRRNRDSAGVISMSNSKCEVRVIPTNEDLMIARHTARVIFGPQ
jgi:acetate kinase